MDEWYPNRLKVATHGTPGTYEFLETVFEKDSEFHYSEFGIYQGSTALNVAEKFPNAKIHLFDFASTIDEVMPRFQQHAKRITCYGNTQKYNDSYNWSLAKIIARHDGFRFDYCFLDGAHTYAIDALNYFLCDILLKVGGHMDFDDYRWRLRGSSLDPAKVPAISDQYTDEHIDAYQVKMIVDDLVKKSGRYEEVVRNKIYRKTRDA